LSLSSRGNEQMGWPSNASAPLRMAEGGESFPYRAELGLSFTVTPTRVDRSEPRGAVSEWNSRQVELSIRGTQKDDIMRCRRLRELEKRQENQGRVEDGKASLSEPKRKKGISPGPLSSRRSAWVAFATLTSSVRIKSRLHHAISQCSTARTLAPASTASFSPVFPSVSRGSPR
jgi:hypothetical protein